MKKIHLTCSSIIMASILLTGCTNNQVLTKSEIKKEYGYKETIHINLNDKNSIAQTKIPAIIDNIFNISGYNNKSNNMFLLYEINGFKVLTFNSFKEHEISAQALRWIVSNTPTDVKSVLKSVAKFKIDSFEIDGKKYYTKDLELKQNTDNFAIFVNPNKNQDIKIKIKTIMPINIDQNSSPTLAMRSFLAITTLGASLLAEKAYSETNEKIKNFNGDLAFNYEITTKLDSIAKKISINNVPSFCFKGNENEIFNENLNITNKEAYDSGDLNVDIFCSELPVFLRAKYE